MIILTETWKRENEALSFNNACNFLSGIYTTDKQWSMENHGENYHDKKLEYGSPWKAVSPLWSGWEEVCHEALGTNLYRHINLLELS